TFGKEYDSHIISSRIMLLVKNNAGRIYTVDGKGELFYIQKNRLKPVQTKGHTTQNDFISISVSDALYNSKIDFTKKLYSFLTDRAFPLGDTAAYLTHKNHKNLFMYYSQTVLTPVDALDDTITF